MAKFTIVEEEFSKTYIALCLLACLVIIAVTSYVIYFSVFEFFIDLYESAAIVTVYKSLYFFIGLLILIISVFFNIIFYRLLNFGIKNKYVRITNIFMLIGLIMAFALPYILHYSLDYSLEKRGYSVCKEMSSISFKYAKYVYTQTPDLCVK